MNRMKIGAQAGGVAGMKEICAALEIGTDPANEFSDYSEIVGQDLTTADIQSGFATDTWRWVYLPQADLDYLLTLVGIVYIRTLKQVGSSRDAANYLAVMHEPTFTRPKPGELLVYGVEIKFTGLVPA